jgi:hypothetical protein
LTKNNPTMAAKFVAIEGVEKTPDELD